MSDLNVVLNTGLKEIKTLETIHDLEQVKAKYIGKTGLITAFMRELKNLSHEERRSFGAEVNQVKLVFEHSLNQQKEFIFAKILQDKLNSETIDVTLSGRGNSPGTLHPVSIITNRMIEIFKQIGFQVVDGPEIESDYYNFASLNIPDSHPARTMQDTFYTINNKVLRTHTSPVQVRYAHENLPPIKIISPGRVFRVDMDATHSPMFHQLEVLWIDKQINFANLKGVVIHFLRKFFENDELPIRFRSSFFPFTEPSAELDIQMPNGKWLEVGGCGMVHPNVLSSMKIDSNLFSGFAIGFGIDRLTMLYYNINDLRLIFDNDLDFLKQFQGEI